LYEEGKLPLQVLNLSQNKISTSGVHTLVEALTKASASELRKLILDKADLEPRAMRVQNQPEWKTDCSHLAFCKSLKSLLRKNKNLKTLSLANCGVSHSIVEAISAAMQSKSSAC
jgi:Ran GTPase-activating protein (RanGAP) involved in mRNA processing and transport